MNTQAKQANTRMNNLYILNFLILSYNHNVLLSLKYMILIILDSEEYLNHFPLNSPTMQCHLYYHHNLIPMHLGAWDMHAVLFVISDVLVFSLLVQ